MLRECPDPLEDRQKRKGLWYLSIVPAQKQTMVFAPSWRTEPPDYYERREIAQEVAEEEHRRAIMMQNVKKCLLLFAMLLLCGSIFIIGFAKNKPVSEWFKQQESKVHGPSPSPNDKNTPVETKTETEPKESTEKTIEEPEELSKELQKEQRMKDIFNVLKTISTQSDAFEEGNPGDLTYTWLVESDSLQLEADDSRLIQRYVMGLIFFSLGGENWKLGDAWIPSGKSWNPFRKTAGVTECIWEGVACDDDSNVITIKLDNKGLTGNIPPEISQLSHLQYLDMSENALVGEIPASFGSLSALEHLYLDETKLSGPVPESVCKLKELEVVAVDCDPKDIDVYCECDQCDCGIDTSKQDIEARNKDIMDVVKTISTDPKDFNGGLPSELAYNWVSQTDSLQLEAGSPYLRQRYIMALIYFSLQGDQWTLDKHWIPSIDTNADHEPECKWEGVECDKDDYVVSIILDNKGLKGDLPIEIAGLTRLVYLDLSSNPVTGEIPNAFGKLDKLGTKPHLVWEPEH